MGGKSISTFHVDTERQLGIWNGTVAIVPALGAAGFCNLESPGLYKTENVPDVSSATGVVLRAREVNPSGLTRFLVILKSKGAEGAEYSANVTLDAVMNDHFAAWSSFVCTLRGQKV